MKRDDGRSKADPYLEFQFGKGSYKTQVKKDTYNPVFNEEFVIPRFHIDDNITVSVYDQDKIRDDWVATFYISPRRVLQSGMNGILSEYPFGNGKDYVMIRLYWQDVPADEL